MPGSRKFTSNLHEIPNLPCVKTPGSCLENSSDFKHCFGLKVEATAENLSTTIRNLYLVSRHVAGIYLRLVHSLIFSVDAFSGWFTNILNLEVFFRFHGSRFNSTFRSRETLLHEQVNKWRTGEQKVWR